MNKKHEEYINSPYKMLGITEKLYTTKSDETITIDPDTGQLYSMKKISQNRSMLNDELVYTKLFQSGVAPLLSLSHSSLKIILYAISIVKPMSEVVILHSSDVCEACGIAQKTFFNNIVELLDKRILSRKLGSSIEFWYDPNIFFNGNRVKFSGYRFSSLKTD